MCKLSASWSSHLALFAFCVIQKKEYWRVMTLILSGRSSLELEDQGLFQNLMMKWVQQYYIGEMISSTLQGRQWGTFLGLYHKGRIEIIFILPMDCCKNSWKGKSFHSVKLPMSFLFQMINVAALIWVYEVPSSIDPTITSTKCNPTGRNRCFSWRSSK